MPLDETSTGLYKNIICPHCGRRISLIVTIYQLKPRRIKMMGLIQNILTQDEFLKFLELSMVEKTIFCIGRIFDMYGKHPSETELAKFIGLSEQTTSKYLKELKMKNLVIGSQQRKDAHGHFQEKQFSLTESGMLEYSRLIYKVLEATRNEKFKSTTN